MHSSDLMVLNVTFEHRVNITFDEYVNSDQENYISHFGEEVGIEGWYEYITGSIGRIKRRMGGAMCQEVLGYVDDAMAEQRKTGNKELHKKVGSKIIV